MESKFRILFLIPNLGIGGAERQMVELARSMDPTRFQVQLVVFYDSTGPDDLALGRALHEEGAVVIRSLHKARGPLGYVLAIPRFMGMLLRFRPHLLYGFMGGTFLGLLAKVVGAKVVWGIRRASADLDKLDRVSRMLLPATLRGSVLADMVIFNSEAGRRNYVAMGLRSRRLAVISNGTDTVEFAPDPQSGKDMRSIWGIPPGAPLVGLVGRIVPVKDHPTFLRAAALVAGRIPGARFVCIGGGAQGDYARKLKDLALELGLGNRLLWAGPCDRMSAAYNALDLLVLASTDEGCPNVVSEAMACGVPCVATDAGDAARLLGDTGRVVPVGDFEALSRCIVDLLEEPADQKRIRASRARERIERNFSQEALARNSEAAFLQLLGARAALSSNGG